MLELNTEDQSNDLDELVVILKQKLEGEKFPGFVAVRSDPAFLKKFLRVKDGNVDAALKAIKNYYAYIQKNLSFFGDIQTRELTDAFNSEAILMLRGQFDQIKVGWVRFKYWKPKEIKLKKMQLAILYILETYGLDPVNQKHGGAVIIDLDGLRLEQVLTATPKELYRFFTAITNGIPVRVKGIHFLNPPTIFWPIFKIIMRILKHKLQNRVFLHDRTETLHKYFEKDKLPLSLGGSLEDLDAVERDVVEELIEKNIGFDEYWQPRVLDKPPAEMRHSR